MRQYAELQESLQNLKNQVGSKIRSKSSSSQGSFNDQKSDPLGKNYSISSEEQKYDDEAGLSDDDHTKFGATPKPEDKEAQSFI